MALATLTLVVAQVAPAASATVDEGWVDDAVRFRESVGLSAGREFVRSTFQDDTYSADAFGVPLSRDEVETIHDRQGRSALAMDANKWAYEQPGFAGAWADQSRDGMIVYQFAEGISAAKEQLSTLLPGKVRYEVVRVDRSLEELRALKGRIAKEADPLGSEGIPVSSVGLSIRGNAVVVGVAGNVEHSRDKLHSRFGDELKVRFENLGSGDTCTGLRNCLPLKGGIRVFDGQGPGDCTSGYIAKKPNGRYALVTAGHCIKIGSQGNNWKHISGGDVLGSADVNNSVWCCTDSGNSGADVGFFTIDTEDEPSNKSKAMVNHANPTVDSPLAALAYDLVEPRWLRLPARPGQDPGAPIAASWWDRGRLWVLDANGQDGSSRLWSFQPRAIKGAQQLPSGTRPSAANEPCVLYGETGTWRLRGDPRDDRLVWLQRGARREYLDWPDGWHVSFEPGVVITDSAGKVRHREGDRCPAVTGTGG